MSAQYAAHEKLFASLPGLAEIDAQIAAMTNKAERRSIMLIDEGSSDKAPVERLIRSLYTWAIVYRCSDIHISGRGLRNRPHIFVNIRTPDGFRNFRLRYETDDAASRWETKLFELAGTPQGATTPDIESTRFDLSLPDHFSALHGLKLFEDEMTYNVDVRVEYTKTYNGFAFITRLLDAQRAPQLDDIGISYVLMKEILVALHLPSGLILTTGPTGSGKTTLQNAMLCVRNDGSSAIHTVEDPVEIALRGIGPIKQVQIGGNITYPRALRSALRSDPDIIQIGEIRDLETLDIALQAASTGHIVLATLHTNSAAEAVTRMLDMTPPEDRANYAYKIAAALKLVLAQRLLSRYDGEVETRKITSGERDWIRTNGIDLCGEVAEVVPNGKSAGKVPVIEGIVVTPDIQRLIKEPNVDVSHIYKVACEQLSFEPLAVGGVRAVQSHGATLPETMSRVEGNPDAERHPGLRVRLAKEHALSFQAVSDAIDAHSRARDNGENVELSSFIEQAKVGTLIKFLQEEAA
ncbi:MULTISPECIES: GspE/PulE family protein [Paraburkholderia]|uniref:ATPase, T2SS/T4P/T4SS family n=1 Tax=Paraburkholderia madseniana TaxID=2599607 RepID=A0AAP5ES42_9BURK|nr:MULTISPECIES: ATPase, T2SS/T4P/T4SS family [Paraburkholderia]MCX4151024.1 ATPase, T2SS/T4P/T4SS family [Paraburkholderia madseniana]MCX4176664.1 ATPase, T2SS/T4P/T4SS family [Paraburkholderia madseniana]MDN7153956.1 Flp pilus assembly complex ATPase component TadA [Paraburkholderia sp. WS6]MDQ6412838.1 Flp pilus assembly complex ATPase component TadA [Paraburkholderia madseniana]MDQ6464655.1 Flp pilus assembly complex ATPase component TadA [Paraburkholderia madseniana]